MALRRAHSDQQSGDVFRIWPCYGETDRSELSVSGFGSKEVVQLLREYDVRLALQEGVKHGAYDAEWFQFFKQTSLRMNKRTRAEYLQETDNTQLMNPFAII